MNLTKKLLRISDVVCVLLSFFTLTFNSSLEAVSSFTRNLGVDCYTCHSVIPQLTEFGKVFLETAGDILIQKDYGMLSMTPQILSGRIALIPIEKTFSSDSKKSSLKRKERQLQLRAFDTISAFLSGKTGKVFYEAVFTASDEWDNKKREGFDVRFEHGFASVNFLENRLNLVGGFDSPFITDGNDTVQHYKVLDRQWEAAEFTPDVSQMVGMNGIEGDFYWIAAWHGGVEVTRGNDPKNYSLRTAYNINKHTLGGYFSREFRYDSKKERSNHPVSLFGLDGHLRFSNVNVLMLLGFRKFVGKKTDWDFSVEANDTFFIKNVKYLTSINPVANIDTYVIREISSQVWVKGSAGVAFFLNPAVRIFPQVSGTIHAPSSFKHQEFKALITASIGL